MLVINESRAKLQKLLAKKGGNAGTEQPDSAIVDADREGINDPIIATRTDNVDKALTSDENGESVSEDIDQISRHDGDLEEDDKDNPWNSDDDGDAAEEAQESLDLPLKLQKAIPSFSPPSDRAHPEQTNPLPPRTEPI